jgi:3-keto-disaccharide hydrolase/FG-GAP-like repeat/FG-GAP repeat
MSVITFREPMKSLLHNVKLWRWAGFRAWVSFFAAVLATSMAAYSQKIPTEASSLSGPSFVPDASSPDGFKASTLAGWQRLGHADWRAEQGEIVGKGTGGSGWLVLDHSYQDTGLYVSFQCVGTCDTGVLMRLHPTTTGMQGTYLEIREGDLKAYTLTLDAAGREVQRKELRPAGGQIRFAPPAPDPSRPVQPFHFPPPLPAPDGVTLPITRPQQGIRDGEWNEIEILLDADILRAFLNNGGGQASVATDDMSSYGPIALFVGKDSEVRFKNIAYKDLAFKNDLPEETGKGFRMQRLSPFYYGWSAAAADFNRDGKTDIVSGPFIYLGPDFLRSREIYPAETYNPSTKYSMNDWVEHAYDFTGDGWPDVLTTSHAGGGKDGAVLYVNPKGESRRWEKFKVVPFIQSEETILKDVDGDGKPELVYVAEGYMRYARPDPANPTGTWTIHTISEKGPWAAHGIGAGDINGDGRMDILGADGWWEQPAAGSGEAVWKYHPVAFGTWERASAGGSEIGVYDVNGDGLNDVVTSLQAHGWGLAWFEQKRATNGDITFVKHVVMNNYNTKNAGGVAFSELHGTAIADVDGDGIPDFIVGKRFWSHLDDYFDPDAYGPAVLYWYKTVRNPKAPGGAELVPHLIHNRSGAGSDVLAIDLNSDGRMDIVTAVRSGSYIFWGTGKPLGKQNTK